MILVAVLGVAVGLAVAAAGFAVAPPPPPLRVALLDLHRPRPPRRAATRTSAVTAIGRAVGADRLVNARVRGDLAVSGRNEDWLLSGMLSLGAAGLASGPFVAAVTAAGGVHLPWGVPVGLSAVAGAGAGLSPLLSLRAEAGLRRQEFSVALSAFVDLVVVAMAGGRGTEGALSTAIGVGRGRVFDALRDALESARLRGVAPWEALDDLGERLAVEDLQGLAASVRLAGSSGAKVRESLAARARALRTRALAESRAAAESETERMSVAVVLLVVGFIVLIGYPAVVQITTQL